MGPRFNYDAKALMDLAYIGGITHDEFRRNLERLGMTLDPWPDGLPRPVMPWEWQTREYVEFLARARAAEEAGDPMPAAPDRPIFQFQLRDPFAAPQEDEHEDEN